MSPANHATSGGEQVSDSAPSCSPGDLIPGLPGLPTPSPVYARARESVALPFSPGTGVARIVEQDPGLAAALLWHANRTRHGLARRVVTVDQAIGLLGPEELQMLPHGATVMDAFPGIPTQVIGVRDLWGASLRAAIAARLLAECCHSAQLAGPLGVAGLLHEAGTMAVCLKLPELARAAVLNAGQNPYECCAVERRVIQEAARASVGMELARQWRFPPLLEEAIGYHPMPEAAPNYPQAAAVVRFASLLAHVPEQQLEFALAAVPEPVWALARCERQQLYPIREEMERRFRSAERYYW